MMQLVHHIYLEVLGTKIGTYRLAAISGRQQQQQQGKGFGETRHPFNCWSILSEPPKKSRINARNFQRVMEW